MNKKWVTPSFSFDDDDDDIMKSEKPQKDSRVLKRNSSNSNIEINQSLKKLKVDNSSQANVQDRQKLQLNYSKWVENITPKCAAELCIHPKKLEEIQGWLNHYLEGPSSASMLHITGPSGSGKTIALRVLCKELDFDIAEWITPIDVEIVRSNSYKNDDENDVTYRVSQSEKFERFLLQSSRYASLLDVDAKRILLVKDFPNSFLKNPQSLHDLLGKYAVYGKSPLVFITTDSKSKQLNMAFNLFGDAVRSQFRIDQISFNAVSSTLMKKALKTICSIMSEAKYSNIFKLPVQEEVDSIVLASHGDIRSAVLNLYVAAFGDSISLAKELLPNLSSKAKKTKNYKLTSIGADENITLMHALGRILYPKFVEESSSSNNTTTLVKDKQLLYSANDITDAFSSQPHNFLSFIHTNYVHRFGEIENIASAADVLSFADMLMSEYREDDLTDYALNISIRGVMLHNENPSSGWKSIRGPRKLARLQNYNDNSQYHKDFECDLFISNNVFVSDYKSYIGIIKSKNCNENAE